MVVPAQIATPLFYPGVCKVYNQYLDLIYLLTLSPYAQKTKYLSDIVVINTVKQQAKKIESRTILNGNSTLLLDRKYYISKQILKQFVT